MSSLRRAPGRRRPRLPESFDDLPNLNRIPQQDPWRSDSGSSLFHGLGKVAGSELPDWRRKSSAPCGCWPPIQLKLHAAPQLRVALGHGWRSSMRTLAPLVRVSKGAEEVTSRDSIPLPLPQIEVVCYGLSRTAPSFSQCSVSLKKGGRMSRRLVIALSLLFFVAVSPPTVRATQPGTSSNFQLVGHDPLVSRGMNAALAIFDHFVYVGSRTDASTFCVGPTGTPTTTGCPHPHPGVLIVDVQDPTNPQVVG